MPRVGQVQGEPSFLDGRALGKHVVGPPVAASGVRQEIACRPSWTCCHGQIRSRRNGLEESVAVLGHRGDHQALRRLTLVESRHSQKDRGPVAGRGLGRQRLPPPATGSGPRACCKNTTRIATWFQNGGTGSQTPPSNRSARSRSIPELLMFSGLLVGGGAGHRRLGARSSELTDRPLGTVRDDRASQLFQFGRD